MNTTAQSAAPQRRTDSDDFAPADWGLLSFLAVTWGASFLFIAIGLEAFAPALVTTLRIAFGAATLAVVPRARRRVPRDAWPGIAALGVVWVALPLLLFPLAQRSIDSSVAGMINGAVPLAAAAVAALLARRLPPARQRAGLVLGFVGVVLISLPAAQGARASAIGVLLVLLAVACYGTALNIAAPLQQRYGALPVLLRAQASALVLVAPLGLAGLGESRFDAGSLAAVAVLGCAGTGLAFLGMTVLVGRVGAARGSIATYFIPVVAIALGVVVRDEAVAVISLVGTALVVAGAWLTSRGRRGAVRTPPTA